MTENPDAQPGASTRPRLALVPADPRRATGHPDRSERSAASRRRLLVSMQTGVPVLALTGSLRQQELKRSNALVKRAQRAGDTYRPHLRAAATAAAVQLRTSPLFAPPKPASAGADAVVRADAEGHRAIQDAAALTWSRNALDGRMWRLLHTLVWQFEQHCKKVEGLQHDANWRQRKAMERQQRQQRQQSRPPHLSQRQKRPAAAATAAQPAPGSSAAASGGKGPVAAALLAANAEPQGLAEAQEMQEKVRKQLAHLVFKFDAFEVAGQLLAEGGGGGGSAAAGRGGGGGGGGRGGGGGGGGGSGVARMPQLPTGAAGAAAAGERGSLCSVLRSMHLPPKSADGRPSPVPPNPADDLAGLPGRVVFLIDVVAETWLRDVDELLDEGDGVGTAGAGAGAGVTIVDLDRGPSLGDLRREELLRCMAALVDGLVRFYGGPVLVWPELQVLGFVIRSLRSQALAAFSSKEREDLLEGGPTNLWAGARAPPTSAPTLWRIAQRAARMSFAALKHIAAAAAAPAAAPQAGGAAAADASGGGRPVVVVVEEPLTSTVQERLGIYVAEALTEVLVHLAPSDPWVKVQEEVRDTAARLAGICRKNVVEFASLVAKTPAGAQSGAGAGDDTAATPTAATPTTATPTAATATGAHANGDGGGAASAVASEHQQQQAAAAGRQLMELVEYQAEMVTFAATEELMSGLAGDLGPGEDGARGDAAAGAAGEGPNNLDGGSRGGRGELLRLCEVHKLDERIELARVMLELDEKRHRPLVVVDSVALITVLCHAGMMSIARQTTHHFLRSLAPIDIATHLGTATTTAACGEGLGAEAGKGGRGGAGGGVAAGVGGKPAAAGANGGGRGGPAAGAEAAEGRSGRGGAGEAAEAAEAYGPVLLQPHMSDKVQERYSDIPYGGRGPVAMRLDLFAGGASLYPAMWAFSDYPRVSVESLDRVDPAHRRSLGHLVLRQLTNKGAVMVSPHPEDGPAAVEAAMMMLSEAREELQRQGRDLVVLPLPLDGRNQLIHGILSAAMVQDLRDLEGPRTPPVRLLSSHWRLRRRMALNRLFCDWLGLFNAADEMVDEELLRAAEDYLQQRCNPHPQTELPRERAAAAAGQGLGTGKEAGAGAGAGGGGMEGRWGGVGEAGGEEGAARAPPQGVGAQACGGDGAEAEAEAEAAELEAQALRWAEAAVRLWARRMRVRLDPKGVVSRMVLVVLECCPGKPQQIRVPPAVAAAGLQGEYGTW